MAYRFAYPNGVAAGYGVDPASMPAGYGHQRSYSPESFSSDSGSSDDDYEYRGRMITRETRHPRDVVRAPTPPPIIKRVVERAPTPEAPVMERVIIRPHAQEIVERVIEQPCTPPPRIIEKEMQEEAPPPIVRTRVIKVDRPMRSGFSQPGSPYGNPCLGLTSFSNGVPGNGNCYHTNSVVGSFGRPAVYPSAVGNSSSFSSSSTFEYVQPPPPTVQQQPPMMMMMMPGSNQVQPMNIMQSVQQQMMHRPVQMQSAIPQLPSHFLNQNYMYLPPRPGVSYGYRPMYPQTRMFPNPMAMMAPPNAFPTPMSAFFNPMVQQLVY